MAWRDAGLEGGGLSEAWSRWLLPTWISLLAAIVAFPILIAHGLVLNNDSVAVPEQDLLPWMWGAGTAPPRAVPQDAIVAVMDNVVPGWLVQRALILGSLLLLGWGVAHLLRGCSRFERVGAASVAVWSTFVFERALMGHWTLLLSVAALPWTLCAAQDLRQGRELALLRLLGWILLGSWVPTGGVLVFVTTSMVLLWPGGDRRCRVLGISGALAGQLVWIVPGVQTSGWTDAGTTDVFGLRAEGLAGPVLTALGTGGLWNSSVMPSSRTGVMSVLAPLVLIVLAGLGARGVRILPPAQIGPLVVMTGFGFGWALLTALPAAGQFVSAVEGLPGGGLLRDAQKWLAPWLILLSVSAGLGMGRIRQRMRDSEAWWPITVLLLAVPIVLLPDLALGAGGRLRPVAYPPEWNQVRVALQESEQPGDVLSLPWSSFRAYPWNADRTVLDPAPRFLPRTVVTDSRLLVGNDEGLAVVASDDSRSVLVSGALRSSRPVQRLLGLGIGWVLWQDGQPATPGYPAQVPSWLHAGGRTVVDSGGLTLIELSGRPVGSARHAPDWPLRAAWMVWLCLLVTVVGGLMGYSTRRLTRARRISGADSGNVRADE